MFKGNHGRVFRKTTVAGLLLLLSALAQSSESLMSEKVGISVIHTGSSAGTQEALVVDTGGWFTRRHLAQTAVLIKHPMGDILVDSGLGKNIDQQFEANGFVDKQIFNYVEVDPAADQFTRNGYALSNISKIIPTHLHWDHASGIEDFPNTAVWVQKAEYDQAKAGSPPVHLPSQLDDETIQWHFITLKNTDYYGFSKSLDVYNDGSIVLVDISGHSAGQLGIFVTLSSGKKYFLIGDTTWTIKGVKDNAQRSDVIKWLVKVNWNNQKNAEQIYHIHKLDQEYPEITVVPAHDERVMNTMAIYPKIEF